MSETMSMPAVNSVVRVADLAKTFRIYAKPSDLLRELVLRRARHKNFNALSGVSFDIGPGHVVGLMGQNGAGKSTLLKILAGTLSPSSGSVAIKGRVSAILELGTGFNPNFTGRENVYLGGLCAGFSRAQIAAKFDEIVDFAELRDVIDQPFRTYSTGMQARLSFSTVIVADPEVLIVDEALSVGDARFQLKSFDKFREFKARGKTIILVSHSSNVITSFCDRAILLDRGRIIADGEPNAVAKTYHRLLFGTAPVHTGVESVEEGPDVIELAPLPAPAAPAPPPAPPLQTAQPQQNTTVISKLDQRADRYGNRMAEIVSLAIHDTEGRPCQVLTSGARYRIVAHVKAHTSLESLAVGFLVRDTRGTDLFGTDTVCAGVQETVPTPAPGHTLEVAIAVIMTLAAGTYFLAVGAARKDGLKYDMWFDAMPFQVIGTPALFHASIANLAPKFEFVPIESGGRQSVEPARVVADADGHVT
ncbi:MAG TPA: ABC transporter ATP-binding protein [Aliidongia sp.]|nr:ABC transporter ATP-binding protein [Aliidongia sp.]